MPTKSPRRLELGIGRWTTAHAKTSSQWVEVVDVYPNPKVSLATDNDVCVGNDWQGQLSGASDVSWTGNADSVYTACGSTVLPSPGMSRGVKSMFPGRFCARHVPTERHF